MNKIKKIIKKMPKIHVSAIIVILLMIFTVFLPVVTWRESVVYALWEAAPTITGEIPANTSTGISLQPTCNVTVNDHEGDSMTITWYSNSSGLWVVFATDTVVSNGTYCHTNTNFSNYSTTYWWNVTVKDKSNETQSDIWHFTTRGPVSNIHPPDGSTDVCPCCDAMCVDVDNNLGHNMNVTIYGRDSRGCLYWHIWNSYTNISNGTYCYCMDAIRPSQRTHAVVHTHTNQTCALVDTWYNVTYDHGHAIRIDIAPDMKSMTILEHGHYTITYWAVAQSNETNPDGDVMATHIVLNGVELDGSYREVAFGFKGRDRNVVGFAHDEFFPGDILQFQYITDDTDSELRTSGTWSPDNLCFYAYIEKTGMEEINPLQFNTTYKWYINVTDAVTGASDVSEVYEFTTAKNLSDCPCGNATIIDLISQNDHFSDETWIAGLSIMFGGLGIILAIRRRRNRYEK